MTNPDAPNIPIQCIVRARQARRPYQFGDSPLWDFDRKYDKKHASAPSATASAVAGNVRGTADLPQSVEADRPIATRQGGPRPTPQIRVCCVG